MGNIIKNMGIQRPEKTNYQSMKELVSFFRFETAKSRNRDEMIGQCLEIEKRDITSLKNLRDFAELYLLGGEYGGNAEKWEAELYEAIRLTVNNRIRLLGGEISSVISFPAEKNK